MSFIYMTKYIKKFDTNTNYNKFVMSRDYIEPHISAVIDTGISSINYNIPNNVIMFGYKYVDGGKPIIEEQVKYWGTVKEFIYDDENGIGKIVFENDVTNIGSSAFCNCTSLNSINIPGSVTSIGDYAFNRCTSLTSITIPNSVTSIGNYAFVGCYIQTNNFINNSNLDSKSNNYWGCNIYDFMTEDTLYVKDTTVIGVKDKNRNTYIIPDSVTSIGNGAFYNCTSLASITIPDSVTSIGDSAFNSCTSLTSITIPNSVTSIGNYAFVGCSNLESITIPDSVTSIGNGAFYNCTSLTSITIPNSVTSIGDGAFYSCTSLTSINYTGTLDQFKLISDKVLQNIKNNQGLTITCSDGKYDASLNPIS